MKKTIFLFLFTLFALLCVSNVSAQYSNASLNGAWFAKNFEPDAYIIFDGQGNISEFGAYDGVTGANVGTYSVTTSGYFSGSLLSHPLTGQFINPDSISFTDGIHSLSRMPNPGALYGTWTGSILDVGTYTFTVNELGKIISPSSMSGHIFSKNGQVVGFINTKEIGCWEKMQLTGTYSNNTISCNANSDCRDLVGALSLTHVVTSKTVTINAGGLFSALTESEKATTTHLNITGVIDARDFKTMRDHMNSLSNLDISKLTIAAYSGTEGTYSSETTNYPANEIPAWAFHYSDNTGKLSLTHVFLPESITVIGESAFDGCANMNIGDLPTSIINIKYAAFYNCPSIINLTVPESVITIEEQAFAACGFPVIVNGNNQNYSSINGVLFNKNLTELLYFPVAISGSYSVPSTVKTIGNFAFYWCNKLTSITIPSTTTHIGYYAFRGCTSLIDVNLPSLLDHIGNSAFSGCTSLTIINLPTSLNFISNYAFYGCSSLNTVNLPSSLNNIGNSTFSGCVNLTAINLPLSLKYIGISAFYGCSSLTSINLPSSLDSIGATAFFYCWNLKNINIPASVKVIGYEALLHCFGPIYVDEGNPNYSSSDGLLYDKTKTTLIQCPFSKTGTVEIASSVTNILFYAFIGCACEVSVDENHLNYSSVNGILFNKSKSKLIFYPTSKSGSFTFPASVTHIGSWSFYDCYNLTSVTIPPSVTTFGYGSFHNCSGLTSVYSQTTFPIDISFANNYHNNIFGGVNIGTCILYVPEGSKILYQQADQWKDFQNIVEIATGISTNKVEEISIWPSPSIDYFYVQGIDDLSKLSIFDINGKKLLEKQVSGNEKVSITNLPKGLYIVRIVSNNATIERKLIKK